MRHLCLLQTCEKVDMHMLDNELAQTFKRSTARNYKTAKKVSKLSNN